jgi:hypothetical protein
VASSRWRGLTRTQVEAGDGFTKSVWPRTQKSGTVVDRHGGRDSGRGSDGLCVGVRRHRRHRRRTLHLVVQQARARWRIVLRMGGAHVERLCCTVQRGGSMLRSRGQGAVRDVGAGAGGRGLRLPRYRSPRAFRGARLGLPARLTRLIRGAAGNPSLLNVRIDVCSRQCTMHSASPGNSSLLPHLAKLGRERTDGEAVHSCGIRHGLPDVVLGDSHVQSAIA